MKYYVNKGAQPNGDHEVHKLSCYWMPNEANRQYLGDFDNCRAAVRESKKYFSQTNGCFHCSLACHTQ